MSHKHIKLIKFKNIYKKVNKFLTKTEWESNPSTN
jgi:hypothetical protein